MSSSPSLGTASLKSNMSRRLTKLSERRRTSMEVPERFQVDDDEEEEDAARADESRPEAYVQQSMYGLITAAHSKGSFGAEIQPDSDSDTDTEVGGSKRNSRDVSRTASEESSRRTSLDEQHGRTPQPESRRHRKNKMSESKMLRSFLKPIRERSDSQPQDPMTHSQFLPPKDPVAAETQRPATAIRSDAPVMDQKLQAKARAEMESSISSSARKSRDSSPSTGGHRPKGPTTLPKALADIFQFDKPEEVISEYACWYLQSVLLQGYMYITQKHVCFYAYLQKKGNVIKSGHLGKQGKRNPRFRRYWFTLKGDVFSYYASAAEPYFPIGTIDLRYAISADMAPEKGQDRSKEVTTFTVVTDKRTYCFRADSTSSAKEWVRQLQKVIFRSHNDGDSVKISLPLENIMDVEATSVVDIADTVKLRVIDNDETYAVDEYFFTFFSYGKDALNVLTLMTQDNDAKKAAVEDEPQMRKAKAPPFRRSVSIDRSPRLSQSNSLQVQEPVRSTLSPMAAGGQSPRVSGEQSKRSSTEVSRASFDRGRASFDRGRRSGNASRSTSQQWRRTSKSPLSPSVQESSESFDTSSDHASGAEMDMTASQVLTAPTLRMPQPKRTTSGSTVERLRQEARDESPCSSSDERARTQRSSKSQAQTTLTTSPTRLESSVAEQALNQKSKDNKSQPIDTPVLGHRPKRSIATPLQHAFTLAGVVRDQGKRMSSYLSSSPKSYYEKFSGAIAGGKRHYTEADGPTPEDRIDDPEDDMDVAEHERRFQQHFALPETERLRATYYCWLHRVLPLYGKIYLSDRRFCFRSLLYGTRTKLVVPFREIDNVAKEKSFRWGYPGIVLVLRGYEELFFDFGSQGVRDDCCVTVLRALDVSKAALDSVILTEEEKVDAEAAAAENELLLDARKEDYEAYDDEVRKDIDAQLTGAPPMMFDDPTASVLDFRPKQPMRITCLTIGSRGDVQPYIALCKVLNTHGHTTKIATHAQFEDWIRKHGIDFAPVEGDPATLMRLCVENGMFTPSFVVETSWYARDWLDKLLESSWKACQNTDLLLESPSAMAGIHIAEALGVPYFRAFTMPWTKTRAYPHAFATLNQKMGGQYNYMTYLVFENVFWRMTAGQINKWRRKTLKLKPTDLGKLQTNKVPFLYNFSPSVVAPPLDFSDWIRVTGYWFLDEANQWTPPDDLLAFIKKARDDNMKLVYIGFGSIPVNDSKQLTQQIVDAVLKADVRCIFSKGWSDHFDTPDPNAPQLPSAIFQIRAAPHDWLFQQIDAAVHHGGCGTTGASLRAGLPTIIKPFFGDQFFFASRVEDLGVGHYLRRVTVNSLGKAIWVATHDERMRTKARVLGEKIRAEDGVENAVNAIYRDLDYARTLIKKNNVQADGGDDEDAEESWTFIEKDSDVDVTSPRRTSDLGIYTPGTRQPSLGSMVLNKGRQTNID